MRNRNPLTISTVKLALFALLFGIGLSAQAAPELTVGDYQLIDSRRVSRTVFEYTYSAEVTNSGSGAVAVSATLTVANPALEVIDGALAFGDVPASAIVTSSDTFSVRQDRRFSTTEADFLWDISATPEPTSSISVDVSASQTSGAAGTLFELAGDLVGTTEPVESWNWDLGDGRSATGQNPVVSYNDPGIYQVLGSATQADGDVYTAELGLVVFDPSQQTPALLDLPAKLGDVDGDGELTLADAFAAAQYAGGLRSLSEAERDALELDFEGDVTVQDGLLIARAVMDDAAVPSVLLPDTAQPGAAVTMITSELMDPAAKFEVEVGASAVVQELTRAVLGYGNFQVPLDPTTVDSMQIDPGPVPVRLYKDGVLVQTFELQIETPTPLSDSPVDELLSVLDRVEGLLEDNQSALTTLLDELGIDGVDREILMASAVAAQQESQEALDGMRALLSDPDNVGLAELILRIAYANGLGEVLAQTQLPSNVNGLPPLIAFAAATPNEVCDVLLPTYCTFLTVAQALDTTSKVTGFLCNALLVGVGIAIAVPADGPVIDIAALTGWLALCSKLEAGISIANAITGIVTKFDAELVLEVSPTALSSGDKAAIETLIRFAGLDDICALGADKGLDALLKYVAERAVADLLRRKLGRTAMQAIFQAKGGTFLNDFLVKLTSVTQTVIKEAGVGQAFGSLAGGLCDYLAVGASLRANASRIMQSPSPDVGQLAFNADGTAEYSCPTAGSGQQASTVNLTATKDICGKTQTQASAVQCASGNVTIIIGDNGSLNDDIFEVRIDGQTVLTSSSPTRGVSTTVNLPAGDTTVQMIGRAAPDGIGTYYIQFSGDVVSVSGDALSGTDLTPGRVKTYVISVE